MEKKMKKFKTFFWIVLAGFLLILFFSNLDFFLKSQSIHLNLILKNYSLPALPNAVISLIFFGAGLLIAFISNLPERFRLKKTIKNLQAAVDSQDKEIERIRTIPKPAIENSTSETT